MRIHCLQHVAFETPATIAEWAELAGHTMSYTYLFESKFSLPLLTDFDALLVMGGSMNIDEEEKFPWLKQEKTFIKHSIDAGKKIIGICLGAQLVATVLGSKVYKGKEKEIGFFPVAFSIDAQNNRLFEHFEQDYYLFHWHGDTFDLPEGAVVMASTTACKHQAYLINGTILGLQFHLEMNEGSVEQMLSHDDGELKERGTYIQSIEEIRRGYTFLERNRKDMFVLLTKFFNSSPGPFSTNREGQQELPPLYL
jgi:GMP synthase-like glutamine amidotransferase